MIGNDIVDLLFTSKYASRKKRIRFLDKVFTKSEQEQIHSAKHTDQMIWRIWSMKESAYKAYVREFKKPFFDPHKLYCEIISDTSGTVTVKEICYKILSQCNDHFVYSSIQPDSLSINNVISTSPIDLAHLGFPSSTTIKKDIYNIPYLINCSKRLPGIISKTHHGRYVAYSISKSN